ncbi:putative aquaporin NIP7-1 [Acorus gramineus]|uniref:Aquaporin NIP7-1 n=1 Tax=Acorus gramineus TaxID=55184 RepID=A0AAV9A0B3_ACOGR|nr:putative aquaporin NIP7-1 [Acorus gramineus]
MEYALTGGFSIIVIMFCIGYISGAHINPSITIALATVGQFPWCKVPFYVGVQLGASVLAAYVGKIVYDMPCDLAVTEPLGGIMRAFIAEFIATLFIMFLVSAIISNIHSIGWSSAFGFGAAVSLAVLITGPVSGGSLNPARSFGPAIISERFEDLWLYFVAPTVGSIVGAFLFRLLQLEQQTFYSLSANSSPTAQSVSELRA